MKKIIGFISCIAITVIANAQTPIFQWAKSVGGTASDLGYGAVIDASGNVYTVGHFSGTGDFDPGPAALNFTSAGDKDIFVTKLDSSGNLVWSEQFGGLLTDEVFSLAVDASGNVYIGGAFEDVVDFDPGPGVFNLTSAGVNDMFILKLDAAGNFLWVKRLGGPSADYVECLALDSSGNVYTSGVFKGTADFDPGPATFNLTATCVPGDIFVSKLDSAGNFIWAKNIRGTSTSAGWSIATDISGNVYTTGFFIGTTDFDPGAGVFNITSSGGQDIFILKLDAAGNFLWVKNIGTSLNEAAYFMKTDSSGNVYSIGVFQSTVDFDPGPGINNLTSAGSYDAFILKLDASGNFLWADDIGGTGSDNAVSLAMDVSGNIYTTGSFTDTSDFDPGTGIVNLTAVGPADTYILKLDSAGNFMGVDQMGGTGYANGLSVVLDGFGNIYIVGDYDGTIDFDPGAGTFDLTSQGNTDVFIMKMGKGISTSVATENAGTDNISIYPNPTNNVLNVVLPKSLNNPSVEIYNSIGALVYNKRTTEGISTIELTDQAKGIYFVKIISNNIVTTEKIVKE